MRPASSNEMVYGMVASPECAFVQVRHEFATDKGQQKSRSENQRRKQHVSFGRASAQSN